MSRLKAIGCFIVCLPFLAMAIALSAYIEWLYGDDDLSEYNRGKVETVSE